MRQKYLRTWDDISLLLFFMLFRNIAAFYFNLLLGFQRPLWGQTLIGYQLSLVAATFAMLGTAGLLLRPDAGRIGFMLKQAPSAWRLLAVAVCGAILCVFAAISAFALVKALFGERAAQVSFDTGMRGVPGLWDVFLLFVTLGILVPLAEELLFRRWLFGRLAAIGRTRVFVPVSTISFGIVHLGQSSIKVITIMALGGLCAWLFVRTRNVLWPWLAHIVNNTLTLTLAVAVAGW